MLLRCAGVRQGFVDPATRCSVWLLLLLLHAGTSSMSGVVYITDEDHKQLLDEAYCMFSWTNPLHADVFPSVRHSSGCCSARAFKHAT